MHQNRSFLVWMIAFIALQPVVDVLTTISAGSSITAGIILRFFYMAAMIIIVLMMMRKSRMAKIFFWYLAGLAALIAINIGVNLAVKDPYLLFEELKFFNKVVYLHIVLFGLILIYRQLVKMGDDVMERTKKMFFYSSLITSFVFIVSLITGTSLENYRWSKIGFTGWFYAGNEIGAIMAIIIPVVAMVAIHQMTSWKKWYVWIPFVLFAFSMQMLGTKVGYGAVIIALAASVLAVGWQHFMVEKKAKWKANLGMLAVLFALTAVTSPFTPTFHNVGAHIDLLEIDWGQSSSDPEDPEAPEEDAPEEDEGVTSEQMQNLIFSSREVYLQDFVDDFASSPLLQQMFGMGFAGNYEVDERPTMIEMDYYDIFFSFGIIGFFYFMAPIVFFLFLIAKRLFTRFKETMTIDNILWGTSLVLALGIGAMAGHVFTAPAVTIYFAAGLAVVLVNNRLIKVK